MLRRNSPAPEITVLDSGGGDGLTFAGACEALGVSSGELTTLREAGLVACLRRKGRQIYPRAALDLTRILLSLGEERDWDSRAPSAGTPTSSSPPKSGARSSSPPSRSAATPREGATARSIRPAPGWRPATSRRCCAISAPMASTTKRSMS